MLYKAWRLSHKIKHALLLHKTCDAASSVIAIIFSPNGMVGKWSSCRDVKRMRSSRRRGDLPARRDNRWKAHQWRARSWHVANKEWTCRSGRGWRPGLVNSSARLLWLLAPTA